MRFLNIAADTPDVLFVNESSREMIVLDVDWSKQLF